MLDSLRPDRRCARRHPRSTSHNLNSFRLIADLRLKSNVADNLALATTYTPR
jgi:hypothetical protein